jgi:hypothetical protein
MPAQRCCKLCLETFEIERKRGRPREYCPDCSPAGYQVVWLRGRHKLRARPPSFRCSLSQALRHWCVRTKQMSRGIMSAHLS